MFDNYYSKEYIPYEKSVKISEYRAPTDESVKLLRDFEKEALNKLIGVYEINDNSFNSSFHIFKSPESFGYKVIGRFQLNSKEFKFEFTISPFDTSPIEKGYVINDKLIEIIRIKIIEKISEVLSIDLFKSGEFKYLKF